MGLVGGARGVKGRPKEESGPGGESKCEEGKILF